MAPEQFRGEVTPAVDIYALGCVLFQLLTGTPPFNGPTEQIVYGHLHGPVPSVVERSKGIVPEAAQGVIDRALAKHPGERFASAGELARAFVAVSGESRAAPTYALHPVPPLSPAHDQATQRGASPAVTLGRV
jgi:eukaryotic-like serine/threonine-protein kinase